MKLDWSITKVDSVTNKVKFDINNLTTTVEGIDALCQKIVKRILTAKGSNQFSDTLGANFFNLFGTTTLESAEQVKQIIPILVDDLTSQIKNEQADDMLNNIQLDDSEILTDIKVAEVNFDPIYGGWLITLNILTKTSSTTISIP